jgi:hypothetical protein
LALIISLIDLLYPPIFLNETASAKAQVIGQDLINIILGIPALIIAMNRSKRGSYKARTIWLGLLAYFAYTFLSYALIFELNPGFLAYTAAFGLSLYATLLNISRMDVDRLEMDASPSVRKWTPYSMVVILLLIAILWTPDVAACARVLGQVIVFVISSLIMGAYTRHYFNGIEIRDSS